MESWNIVVPASLVALGWFVNAWLERRQKKFDLVNQYLIDAYRRLERASNRDGAIAHEYWADLESVVADIFLFGSKETVDLVIQFSQEMGKQGGASANKLLEALRNELRANLELGHLQRDPCFLRFRRTDKKPAPR